jgi:hypothetical protein
MFQFNIRKNGILVYKHQRKRFRKTIQTEGRKGKKERMKGKTAMELIDNILLVPSHLRKSLGRTYRYRLKVNSKWLPQNKRERLISRENMR